MNPPRETPQNSRITHALTVDVEDYFQVEAFRRYVGHERWHRFPIRVADNTYRLLDLFDRFGVRATFFTLGWVAKKCPLVVAEIVKRGHELGCHSQLHRLVYELDPDEFRRDTREATNRLEDAAGVKVRGYRAPSYSITKRSLWALEVLASEGYAYDSSIFPIRHDVYGYVDFPRFPVRVDLGGRGREQTESSAADSGDVTPPASIIEFPPCTATAFGMNFPGPGGGYLRIFPQWYSLWALRQLEVKDRRPGTVYIHPWEIDPEQPRLAAHLKSRLRHYTGLKGMERRLETLLERFAFAPMGEVLERYPPTTTWARPAAEVALPTRDTAPTPA